DPQGRGGGAAGGAAPVVPVPLPARGGPAHVRGRPAREEGAEEEGAGRAQDRAVGRGSDGCRGRGDRGVLLGGPQRPDGRRPAAAGGEWAETPRPVGGHLPESEACGGEEAFPKELTRLKGLIDAGLSATSRMWPGVRAAFGWVHQAAHVLGQEQVSGVRVRRQLSG